MAKSYYEKLKDPRWQRKRLEVMQRDDFRCLECGSKTDTLNVHHGCYIPARDPWDYPDYLLHTLCEDCHETTQRTLTTIHAMLGRLRLEGLAFAVNVLIAGGACSFPPEASSPEHGEKSIQEYLSEVQDRIDSLEKFGDPNNASEASRLKNLRQMAIVLSDEMAKEVSA